MNYGEKRVQYTKSQLKKVPKESLMRYAKYIGLRHSLEEMSVSQLSSLIVWRLKRLDREY